jgi:hypothetical protein
MGRMPGTPGLTRTAISIRTLGRRTSTGRTSARSPGPTARRNVGARRVDHRWRSPPCWEVCGQTAGDFCFMPDVIMLMLIIVFFALAKAYAGLCDRVLAPAAGEADSR